MKALFSCRRSTLALYAITLLAIINYTKGNDTSMAISTIVIAVAGANAYEKRGKETNKNNSHSNS